MKKIILSLLCISQFSFPMELTSSEAFELITEYTKGKLEGLFYSSHPAEKRKVKVASREILQKRVQKQRCLSFLNHSVFFDKYADKEIKINDLPHEILHFFETLGLAPRGKLASYLFENVGLDNYDVRVLRSLECHRAVCDLFFEEGSTKQYEIPFYRALDSAEYSVLTQLFYEGKIGTPEQVENQL